MSSELSYFVPNPGESTEAAVRRAFAQFRASHRPVCVFVLPAEERPSRPLVDLVVQEIALSTEMKLLTLVHSSPAVGFLTSSIGLKAPTVQVRAMQDANTAAQRSLEEFARLGI